MFFRSIPAISARIDDLVNAGNGLSAVRKPNLVRGKSKERSPCEESPGVAEIMSPGQAIEPKFIGAKLERASFTSASATMLRFDPSQEAEQSWKETLSDREISGQWCASDSSTGFLSISP
jgi:hypothetical protein